MAGEVVEITALRTNLHSITSAASGNLRWFADRLIEKAFIARDTANGILQTTGKTPMEVAGTLLDSVFTKIETSEEKRRWFDEFVAILSTDVTKAELVKKLRTHVGSGKYILCVGYIAIRRKHHTLSFSRA